MAKCQLEELQRAYSVIILILVCVGLAKIVRQAIERKKADRERTALDKLVESQKPVKAISLATNPTKEGEELGELIMDVMKGAKKMNNKWNDFIEKVKVFFDKFKGFILTAALLVLTLVEMYGGYINELFGGSLTICGYEVLPKVTMVAAVIVGCVSNGFTKEQVQKIKALLGKGKNGTSEIVLNETKKTLKETKEMLAQKQKEKAAFDKELAELESKLAEAQNSLTAKIQLQKMMPTLVSEEDVAKISADITAIQDTIKSKQAEVDEAQEHINNLNTTINALNTAIKSL